jgi:hypothetical protein
MLGMATDIRPDPGPFGTEPNGRPNGEAMAAILAAGIGSFAIGLFVILHSAGIFSAPAIHAGAGGVSGRTTLGIVAWLIAWLGLHFRWKGHHIEPRGVYRATVLLIVLGLIATFPPIWVLL